MNQRLIYVMGPSGAGKDSLLDWLKNRLMPQSPIHFAKRTIDRPVQAQGEQHESVDSATFERLQKEKSFAMHWLANGRQYGVRHSELEPLQQQQWLLVNGSRAYLPEALRQFDGLSVLHIIASADILRARLLARQRETPEVVEARVQRAVAFIVPPSCHCVSVLNDSSLDDAGAVLVSALSALPGWPAGGGLKQTSTHPTHAGTY
jgi:ribose 1,5-bisphosphokinase